jgi:DNA-directed RNA polymerase specialized sigma24 family protein
MSRSRRLEMENGAKQLLKDMRFLDKTIERYKIEYALNNDKKYKKLINENIQKLIQKKELITKCMNEMSVLNQEIIYHKYFEGMTNEEIADEIAFSPRTTWDKVDEAIKEFMSIYDKFA